MRLDVPQEQVLSAADEIAELEARLAAAEQAGAAAEQAGAAAEQRAMRAVDAHRKLKARGADARVKARQAAKDGKAAALKAAKGAARQRANERIKAARERLQREAREQAAQECAAKTAKLVAAVAAARARARKVEAAAKLSGKRLRRAQRAEAITRELQASLEEEPAEDDEEDAEGGEPSKQQKSRREGGRFAAMPQEMRILIWAQLSRRVAPSAIGSNISDAISALSPEETTAAVPSEPQIRRMRGELTIASECIASFRVALAKRIISFGWDETTKFGHGLLSSNTQIETADGDVVDVVMRGALLTAGGTAEAIAWAIDSKIFAHARRLIKEWSAAHEAKFGEGSWAAAGGPSPESIGMHRLGESTLLLTDTCNAARAAKRLVAEAAIAAGKERIGEQRWAAMTEVQRDAECKVYIGQCHQHLRNIIINAMQSAATEELNLLLADSLVEFSSFDRMSADVNDLVYAVWKALHHGGEYAKGWGCEFAAWLKQKYPHVFVPSFECAKGSRMDISLNGCVPIFINRKLILEYLKSHEVPGAAHKLAKFLSRTLSCNEITAMLRVNTIW
eukprot:1572441-Prymnesium_polylepis.1